MGVRLDWSVLSLAMGETPKMMWRMARPYLPAVGAGEHEVGVLQRSATKWAIRPRHVDSLPGPDCRSMSATGGCHGDQPQPDRPEVLAAKKSVARRGEHFKNAVVHLKNRNVERAAAEIIDSDALGL